MRGTVFNIQRFSIHDGPGIRTTVFFKGCNLKCAWCHNPESQNFKPELMLYMEKCTLCGKCREFCPKAFTEECTRCGKCAEVCPSGARALCGYMATAEQVMETVLRDRPFYENSGGGVTFSGGECMLQTDFLLELLKLSKENRLHTCVDTAGDVPWEYFEKLLPYTDLFLYDLKLSDGEKHKKYTGVDNARITENLKKLKASGANVTVCVPLIGGVNDNAEELRAMKTLLGDLGIFNIDPKPYHALGEKKYAALGRVAEKFRGSDIDTGSFFGSMT